MLCRTLSSYHDLWVQAASEVAEVACPRAGTRENGQLKPWDGRSPLSIAAAIIYLVTRLPKVSIQSDVLFFTATCYIRVSLVTRHTARLQCSFVGT